MPDQAVAGGLGRESLLVVSGVQSCSAAVGFQAGFAALFSTRTFNFFEPSKAVADEERVVLCHLPLPDSVAESMKALAELLSALEQRCRFFPNTA